MADGEQPAKRARTEGASEPPSSLVIGGVRVASVGLGCLALSVGYPSPPPPASVDSVFRSAASAALPHALFVDTADVDCHPYKDVHQSERALGALQNSLRSSSAGSLAVSTKSGMKRVSDDSKGWRPGSTSPDSVRSGIFAARAALSPGLPLFLYSLHHADAFSAPGCIEAALQVAAACVAEGLVSNIVRTAPESIISSPMLTPLFAATPHQGLANATVPLLERARLCGAVPIAAVQNEWSLFARDAEKERPATAAASSQKGVLQWCAAHHVPFIAYAPLGGLKARRGERQALGAKVPAIAVLAAAKGVSQQAIALAAMLHRGRQIGAEVLVLVGARSKEHILASMSAASVRLTPAEAVQVMGALPA